MKPIDAMEAPVERESIPFLERQQQVDLQAHLGVFRQQAALAELSRRVLIEEPLPQLFAATVRGVAKALGTRMGAVGEWVPERQELKLSAGFGWREGTEGDLLVDAAVDPLAGLAIMRETPFFIRDLRVESRFRSTAARLLCEHGVISGLCVAIGREDGPWGSLGVFSDTLRAFTQEDAVFLQTVADVLGVAVVRQATDAALRELSRRLLEAEDAERRRIAKELHDSTAQDLIAVILNLEVLREAATSRCSTEAKQIEDSIALLENSAHDIRTLSYLLHPPRLDEDGLPGAIRHYLGGFGERTGLMTQLEEVTASPRMEHVVELALFRVVQEALGNIHRHSGSPVARVRLEHREEMFILEVRDEGHGMPSQVLHETDRGHGLGVGLPAMRERLRQIGGRLEIESDGRGTVVRAFMKTEKNAA